MKQAISAVILAVAVLAAAGRLAAAEQSDLASLSGLTALSVNVENFRSEIRDELMEKGLTEDLLEVAVVRQLKNAGIRVVPYPNSEPDGAVLRVTVRIVTPEERRQTIMSVDGVSVPKGGFDQRYVYAIRLDLVQWVRLPRDDDNLFHGVTWQASHVAYRKIQRLATDLGALAARFVSDFRSANQ